MDSRAKQRLTGAVILVALFVLLVPELLKGPRDGKPPPESAAEDGLRRYTIDIDSPQSSVQPVQSVAPPEVALPAVMANPMGEGTQAVPGESAQPEPKPQSESPPEPERPSASAVPTPKPPAVVAAPAPVASPPRTETARPAPVTVAPGAGAFAVQLGSFVSRDNADRLVREMTSKGFSAFVAPITSGGRELYRVRVGPTRDRVSAEALAAQLRRIGQPGSIVSIS